MNTAIDTRFKRFTLLPVFNCLSQDGKWLAVAYEQGTIQIYDKIKCKCLFEVHAQPYSFPINFKPIGLFLTNQRHLIAYSAEYLFIWTLSGRIPVFHFFHADMLSIFPKTLESADATWIGEIVNVKNTGNAVSVTLKYDDPRDDEYDELQQYPGWECTIDLTNSQWQKKLPMKTQSTTVRMTDKPKLDLIPRRFPLTPPQQISWPPFLSDKKLAEVTQCLHTEVFELATTPTTVDLSAYLSSCTLKVLRRAQLSLYAFSLHCRLKVKEATQLLNENFSKNTFEDRLLETKQHMGDPTLPVLCIGLQSQLGLVGCAVLGCAHPVLLEYFTVNAKTKGHGSLFFIAVTEVLKSLGYLSLKLESLNSSRIFYHSFGLRPESHQALGKYEIFYSEMPDESLVQRKLRQLLNDVPMPTKSKEKIETIELQLLGTRGPNGSWVGMTSSQEIYFIFNLPEDYLDKKGVYPLPLYRIFTTDKLNQHFKAKFAYYHTKEDHAARVIQTAYFHHKHSLFKAQTKPKQPYELRNQVSIPRAGYKTSAHSLINRGPR